MPNLLSCTGKSLSYNTMGRKDCSWCQEHTQILTLFLDFPACGTHTYSPALEEKAGWWAEISLVLNGWCSTSTHLKKKSYVKVWKEKNNHYLNPKHYFYVKKTSVRNILLYWGTWVQILHHLILEQCRIEPLEIKSQRSESLDPLCINVIKLWNADLCLVF